MAMKIERVPLRIERADWFVDTTKHGKGVTSMRFFKGLRVVVTGEK